MHCQPFVAASRRILALGWGPLLGRALLGNSSFGSWLPRQVVGSGLASPGCPEHRCLKVVLLSYAFKSKQVCRRGTVEAAFGAGGKALRCALWC